VDAKSLPQLLAAVQSGLPELKAMLQSLLAGTAASVAGTEAARGRVASFTLTGTGEALGLWLGAIRRLVEEVPLQEAAMKEQVAGLQRWLAGAEKEAAEARQEAATARHAAEARAEEVRALKEAGAGVAVSAACWRAWLRAA